MGFGRRTSRKQASASEAGGRDVTTGKDEASASEGGEILRTKKEAMEAIEAKAIELGVPLKSKETKPAVDGKKTKVVKKRLPLAFIEKLIATPYPDDDIPDDKLAKLPQVYRDFYDENRARNAKMKAYRQAIIDQYNDKGYAEDESEVTDDEEETVENK